MDICAGFSIFFVFDLTQWSVYVSGPEKILFLRMTHAEYPMFDFESLIAVKTM